MEMTVMDNLFDYLKWRSDLSFSRCRINELDFALFSQIIMIPYTLYIDMPMSKTNNSITLKDKTVKVKDGSKFKKGIRQLTLQLFSYSSNKLFFIVVSDCKIILSEP